MHGYTGSALAARIAALEGVRPERPFAFELDGVLVNGRLDVLWRSARRRSSWTTRPMRCASRDPAEIVAAEYAMQQTIYAIACLRAGASEVEVVYHFLEGVEAVVSAVFTAADRSSWRDDLGRDRAHS